MIIGTAGHIDHGKTTLVKALTGVDADRLPEERARGITLDLGYAYLPLPSGEVLGFIDVPGHERLVHNMLAGATGIDFLLLVVAADDGVMPQTREHLQIADLLGLGRGAVAITKCDVVSAQRVQDVAGEVAELLRGSAIEGAPQFPLSAITGNGIPELHGHLEAAASALAARDAESPFRLAIDRCFTLSGVGTVVTGTAFAGRVGLGDILLLSPPGIAVRVRSLHVQDRAASVGRAGQRCALNIAAPGFERSQVERGHWLVAAAAHQPVQRFDVELRLLPGEEKPLRHWSAVHFHLGTVHCTGRVSLLEAETLAPGERAPAQLALDTPIGVLRGDRFILRDAAASRTIGGGVALDIFPPARGRRAPERLDYLRLLTRHDPAQALCHALESRPAGVDLTRYARNWNLSQAAAERLWSVAGARRVGSSNGQLGFSAGQWQALRARALDALAADHERTPDMVGVEHERLRRLTLPALPAEAFGALVTELLQEGLLRQTGPWLHRPEHVAQLGSADQQLFSTLEPLLCAQRYAPPRVRDVARATGIAEETVRGVFRRVARTGRLYPVAHDHYFTAAAVRELADVVAELNAVSGGARAADLRDRIGGGRKVAIQILEFFDRIGYTRRVRDAHLLRSGSGQALFS